jgi:hypothetical protein
VGIAAPVAEAEPRLSLPAECTVTARIAADPRSGSDETLVQSPGPMRSLCPTRGAHQGQVVAEQLRLGYGWTDGRFGPIGSAIAISIELGLAAG